ncbi:hypothetical protein NWFMUON74_01730 [Nocardia wallacei]|uniref:Uncharacterized protein n=1 Tax=Nocardia wallacei TaxID=480035 RepID=A0A7G1KC40_9NOCA|nr:hypothetical protein NWFMUON74_01730 [Nocardia wallacei]
MPRPLGRRVLDHLPDAAAVEYLLTQRITVLAWLNRRLGETTVIELERAGIGFASNYIHLRGHESAVVENHMLLVAWRHPPVPARLTILLVRIRVGRHGDPSLSTPIPRGCCTRPDHTIDRSSP